LCSELRLEVVVSFVDIGRIVDHHCLNFLLEFINKLQYMLKVAKFYLKINEKKIVLVGAFYCRYIY